MRQNTKTTAKHFRVALRNSLTRRTLTASLVLMSVIAIFKPNSIDVNADGNAIHPLDYHLYKLPDPKCRTLTGSYVGDIGKFTVDLMVYYEIRWENVYADSYDMDARHLHAYHVPVGPYYDFRSEYRANRRAYYAGLAAATLAHAI